MRLKQMLRWMLLQKEPHSADKASAEGPEAGVMDGSGGGDETPLPERKEEVRDGYLLYRESGLCIRVDLPEGITRVGRLNSMDCTLTDSAVSGIHAEFIRSPDSRYFIQDFSADGETYIDGTRIPGGKKELKPGDTVQLGRVLMEFKRRNPPAVVHAAGTAGN